MITAFEAKQISLDSDAKIAEILADISECITVAAHKGERSINYFKERCSWRNDSYDEDKANTPFVNRIINKLYSIFFSYFIRLFSNTPDFTKSTL